MMPGVNNVIRIIIILFPIVALISTPPSLYETLADQGQGISLVLNSADYIIHSTNSSVYQVRVFVNYTINEPSLNNQTINSVMKVYNPNGTLLKTSSSPSGFTINNAGIQRHVTTLANSTVPNVTAVVQFTDASKVTPLSNPVYVKLNLTNPTAVRPVETKPEIAALPPPS